MGFTLYISVFVLLFSLTAFGENLFWATFLQVSQSASLNQSQKISSDYFITDENSFMSGVCTLSGGGQGVSGISLDESTHTLRGSSSTNVFSLHNRTGETCSVGSTLSGPNVSLSGFSSDCTQTNPSVNLTSTAYLANSQYCVSGTHSFHDSCSTSICLTTPEIPEPVIFIPGTMGSEDVVSKVVEMES